MKIREIYNFFCTILLEILINCSFLGPFLWQMISQTIIGVTKIALLAASFGKILHRKLAQQIVLIIRL